MKINYSRLLPFFLVFFTLQLIAQTNSYYLSPDVEVTYGNKTHTGRDEVIHTLKDNDQNIIIAGYTEEDFSFTDVYVSKHDTNLNLLWKRTYSFNNPISYDYPIKVIVDDSNNTYLICKSVKSASRSLVGILKIDPNGNLLWKYEYDKPEFSLGFSIDEPHFFLTENNELVFLISLTDRDWNRSYIACKISADGVLMEEKEVKELSYGPQELYAFKSFYQDGYIVMLAERYISDPSHHELYEFKFNFQEFKKNQFDISEEDSDYFIQNLWERYNRPKIDEKGIIYVVNYGNYRNEQNFTLPNYFIGALKPDGSLAYRILPNKSFDKVILDWKVENGILSIVGNRRPSASENLNDYKFFIEKYDAEGNLIYERENADFVGQIANFSEGKITLLSNNWNMISMDEDLIPLQNYQFNYDGHTYYTPGKSLLLNNSLFLSGTGSSKKYENSDYTSEMDIVLSKISQSGTEHYSYSGKGTSKFYTNSLLKDSKGNYIATGIQNTGPGNYNPGGSRGLQTFHKITYSPGFELISDEVVPEIDREYKVHFNTYQAENGDQYRYEITNDRKSIQFYLNDELKWTREIYNQYSSDEIDYNGHVDSEGNFIVPARHSQYGRVHKVTPENFYIYSEESSAVRSLIILDNDWIFTFDSNSQVSVLSPDLKLLAKNDNIVNSSYVYLRTRNNKVVLQYNNKDSVRVYNQYAEQINDFNLDGKINPENSFLEENGDLVTWRSIGTGIYTELAYQWQRGALRRYKNFVQNYLSYTGDEDSDNDSVPDRTDECPNTPEGEEVNSHGCTKRTLSPSNFTITTGGESCSGKSNGFVTISAIETHQYSAHIENSYYSNDIHFTQFIRVDDLPPGNYSICITSDYTPGDEQCFELLISEGMRLEANAAMQSRGVVSINLTGGTPPYIITLNEKYYSTLGTTNTDLNIKPGDLISISSAKECEGVFKYKVPIQDIILSPNPASDIINLKIPFYTGESNKSRIEIFNSLGQSVMLRKAEIKAENEGIVKLNIENLPSGYYYIRINKDQQNPIKFIKK